MFIHCPICKSVATVPIAYGKPSHETIEAHKYGLIHVAGCVIDDERINRYCKACGCDFISYEDDLFGTHQNQGIPIDQMNRMLDDLESDLHNARQKIEREYMRLGRETYETGNFEIIQIMCTCHDAWANFLDRLQERGDPTIVLGPKNVMARYSNKTARIYLIKQNMEFYMLLADLAKASHWLGRTSRGDNKDIDDLKNASIALQNTRQDVAEYWSRVRRVATGYME
ncbi:hypothetical protein [Limnohabitans sp. 2KL-1]|uniref:hypothetical protein n=1 Tax=Limnohabitans sp. 2KL-1 TaxID=1100699 RepID=UPI0011B241FF|nr:hypothetical protein [Limnohabitans sp. 2KL-1]